MLYSTRHASMIRPGSPRDTDSPIALTNVVPPPCTDEAAVNRDIAITCPNDDPLVVPLLLARASGSGEFNPSAGRPGTP